MTKRKHSTDSAELVLATLPRYILVAFDFGTTFSGASWVQTARSDVQTAIVQWPDVDGSLEGQTSEKVPTQLCYVDEECIWGFAIPEDRARFQWFKLDLDPTQKDQENSLLTFDYPDPKALSAGHNNTPDAVKLVTDYLTQLRIHTEKMLRRKLGDSVVDTTPIRYTITVPAIWSDAAKAKTRQCALAAGMGEDIQMISEPEAAVIYALDTMDPHNLKVGDQFVLTDAGGGTVDLIRWMLFGNGTDLTGPTAYEIVSLNPIVKVREAVPGSGNACGSTFLNRIFRKYLEENLSDLDGYEDDTLEDALTEFENITKRKFTGEEETVILRVPGLLDNAERGIKRQKLTLKGVVLKDLFKPVMMAITTLVKSQLQQSKKARAVILVGGFGQSPYLRSCIQQVIGPAIEIMQPAFGWTAVVRGALLKAIHDAAPEASRVNIISRKARSAYGIRFAREFDDTEDFGQPRLWDSFYGHHRVQAMKWFVEPGDELDQKQPITTRWSRHQKVSYGRFSEVHSTLRVFSPKANESAPEYPNSDVKDLVELTADLSTIPRSGIPIERGKDGERYYKLRYEIRITFFSAHMEFSLWYNGKQYGKVNGRFS